jgi:hypothetical protein
MIGQWEIPQSSLCKDSRALVASLIGSSFVLLSLFFNPNFSFKLNVFLAFCNSLRVFSADAMELFTF